MSQARALQGLPEEKIIQAIMLYEQGLTIDEVASIIQTTRTTVWNHLRKRGLMRSVSVVQTTRRESRQPYRTFFDIIDSEEKAYWLGFICADGWIDGNETRGYRLGIELAAIDEEHLKKFASLFSATITHRERYKQSGQIKSMVSVRVGSKHLIQALMEKGVTPAKSLSEGVADVFQYIPISLLHHFIRGNFDGDGSISRHGRGVVVNMNSGSQRFLSHIRDAITTHAHVRIPPFEKKSKGNMYRINWGARGDCIAIANWLYQDASLYLARKKQLFDNLKGA
jgi:hypothetical protein